MSHIEPMESRRLMSVSGAVALAAHAAIDVTVSSTGTLHVTGTSKADKINVGTSGGKIVVSNNGQKLADVSSRVKRVAVRGGAGKDRVVVDLKASISAKLVGGKGVDKLTVTSLEPFKTTEVFTGDLSKLPAHVDPTTNTLGTPPSDLESADGLRLMAPTSGTTSQGFVSLLPEDLGSQTVQQAEREVLIPTRADNPQIKFGTFPASAVNNWLSKDVNLFAPGHGVGRVVRLEADGSATSYKYDADADTVTVSGRSTDGIFFGLSTVENSQGGFELIKDTVYVEDEKGTKTWKVDTPEEIAQAIRNASDGHIIDALKGSAPDTFSLGDGDGSKERVSLPTGHGGSVPLADVLATMLVNASKVKSDVSTIPSGTKLSLADAKAYFDASVHPYLGAYNPNAKQAGHRRLVVEGATYTSKQTEFVYNDDGTVTVTQITATPLRLVKGADAGNDPIVVTMFSEYEG